MSLPERSQAAGEAATTPGSARSESPVPGQLLGGKYRIEACIAEGGMGVVLRATHIELEVPVAIKLIRPEHVDNEEVVLRLLTEARIAAGLRSKHVNHVLDVGRTAHGLPYLVLEYMEGSDLRGYLERRGRVPLVEAVDAVMQACEALAEAHAFGIVHRDLKPENLFLCEDADGGFVLKVLDFGISKAPATRRQGRTLTNPYEVVGSPNYMAPEQIRGDQVDGRADIWALGALLYELCSGQVPFAAETVTETFSLILDGTYQLPPLDAGPGSEHLDFVIARCLRTDPNERYQSVVELADALSPLGSDELQGRRVAKVAMATRARVIAIGNTVATSTTPLALTAGLESEHSERTEPPPRRRGRALTWSVLGIAALSLVALGFRVVAPEERATGDLAATASRSLPVAVSAAEPATVSAEPTPAIAAAPAAPPTSPARAAARPQPAKPRPTARATAFRPAPPPLYALDAATAPQLTSPSIPPPAPAPEPEPEAAVAPAVEKSAAPQVDAWDPSTFGGRK